MRLSVLTVALLVAGGIGCDSSRNGGSSGTNSTGNGDNGNDGGMTMGNDMGAGGGGGNADGGGGAGGGSGGGDMAIGPGPWPLADITIYGAAQGLGGIIDANPDDAQNIWAAN